MDDDALQARLRGIERRQNLVIALFALPYLIFAAELFGFWVATVTATSLTLLTLAFVIVSRRQSRDGVGM
ncbi:hypothetical protein I7X12_09765 [Halosimplex litoreum]|uniref:Uncharacterized protein n=1 Tax=Halosimplex litoreum TaxID=1198301 RepID=A0A7U3WB69_9EURY|nr:hypothetical protein [Halosimplex litoreum]QPV64864.1 hypothetical protein I7X12_09765 [Halosimplex litoreum]